MLVLMMAVMAVVVAGGGALAVRGGRCSSGVAVSHSQSLWDAHGAPIPHGQLQGLWQAQLGPHSLQLIVCTRPLEHEPCTPSGAPTPTFPVGACTSSLGRC